MPRDPPVTSARRPVSAALIFRASPELRTDVILSTLRSRQIADGFIPDVTGITQQRGCDVAVGRPREFDPDQVEDAAMKLFWERGFDGVSISDVTAVTGVNRRSIYAEFGSKEKLFERAAERYLAGPGDY